MFCFFKKTTTHDYIDNALHKKIPEEGLPWGFGGKEPAATAGDMGLIPAPRRLCAPRRS